MSSTAGMTTSLTTFAGVRIGTVLEQAMDVCAVSRDTFDAGSTGLAGMRSAVEAIDLALARWNALAASGASSSARPATEKEIGGALLVLVQGFPNAEKDRYADLTRLMVGYVVEARPSIGALAGAVEALHKTCKFLPSIAEVLEAIRAADEPLRWAPQRVEELKQRRHELNAKIATCSKGG